MKLSFDLSVSVVGLSADLDREEYMNRGHHWSPKDVSESLKKMTEHVSRLFIPLEEHAAIIDARFPVENYGR